MPKAKTSPFAMDDEKFEREEDLRTLQRAAEIQGDKRRMAGVKRALRDQQAAADKVQKAFG